MFATHTFNSDKNIFVLFQMNEAIFKWNVVCVFNVLVYVLKYDWGKMIANSDLDENI